MKALQFVRVFAVAIVAAGTVHAQAAPRALTLDDAVRLAQAQGSTAISARQGLDIARYQNQRYNADFRPQLSLTGSAVNFNRGITPIPGPTGETKYVSQAENQSSLGAQLSQKVGTTGGTLTLSSGLSRIDQFGLRTGQSWSSTPVTVGYTQNLFRPNPDKWEPKAEALGLTIAERQFVQTREEVASAAVSAFFEYYIADLDLRNALANVAINDTISSINKYKYDRGTINEGELLQSDYALLRVRANADGARLNKARAEATLRRLLGLSEGEPISIVAPALLGLTTIDPEVAVKAALENGTLRDQNELQTLQARRQIEDARLNAGFNASVSATVGFNQTAPGFFDAYQSPLGTQRLGIGVRMPVLQGGAGKANQEAARVSLARVETDSRARRAEVSEQARFAALTFVQSQSALALAAKGDSVAARRFTVTKAQYDRSTSTLTELLLAQADKDAALVSSAQALRGYWVAYYALRRITLFDFVAGAPIRE